MAAVFLCLLLPLYSSWLLETGERLPGLRWAKPIACDGPNGRPNLT